MIEFIAGSAVTVMVYLTVKFVNSERAYMKFLKEQTVKAERLVNESEPVNGHYFNITKALEELVNPDEKIIMDTGSLSNAGEIYIEHLAKQIRKHPRIWRSYFKI